MTVVEEQHKKFGKSCRWLSCDDMMHCTQCLKKVCERQALYERFEELKFKHPEVAIGFIMIGCKQIDPEYKCFDGSEKHADLLMSADEELTYTEDEDMVYKEAVEKFKDDELVKKLYKEAKMKWVSIERSNLEHELENLKAIESDEEI